MADKDKQFEGTLEVSGTGKVAVAPDEAVVHLSVITEAKTANEAVKQNAKSTKAVIDAVSAQPNHGVTTSGLGVSPLIHYDSNTHSSKIIGYRATNGVTVKTKIGYAAQVFDAGVQAGANESSGISFGVQDETPYREEALRRAVEIAFSEAQIVAKAAKVQLDGPGSIWIDSGMNPLLFRTVALEMDAAPTPVIPEDLKISASVRIVFRTCPAKG
jgi:uncharacterized protein YggE